MNPETLQISQNDTYNSRLSGDNIKEGVFKALENGNPADKENNRQEQKQPVKPVDLKNELAQVAVALSAGTANLAMIFKLREKTENEYGKLRATLGLPHDENAPPSIVRDDIRANQLQEKRNVLLERQKELLGMRNQNYKKAA